MEKNRILVLNLGSTSTKIALYQDADEIFSSTLHHEPEELQRFEDVWEQYDLRRDSILLFLKKKQVGFDGIQAIASRGGTFKPVEGGIYKITREMVEDTKTGLYGGHHATNVGCAIALDLGNEYGVPVFTVDPPSIDEFCPEARFSGHPLITRKSSFHGLNQKAAARAAAALLGKPYENTNLIVVHLGGGISVAAHRRGRIVEANNTLEGEGAFTPERTGALPVGDVIKLCFDGGYTKKEIVQMVNGRGGLWAYLGTTSGLEVEKRIAQKDDYAQGVYEAMAYQISKEIGACAAVLEGCLDSIVLTGSLAYSQILVNDIARRVSFLAPLRLLPGENEMKALAEGVSRYLQGVETLKEYRVKNGGLLNK